MKKIRKIAENPIMTLFMCSLILFVSCNQDDIATNSALNELSGEELFKSIIFVDGEATSSIPILDNINIYETLGSQEKIDEYKKLQNETIEFIKQQSPNYFDEFKSNITSKDPQKISSTLNQVGNYLIPFANEKLKVHGIKAEDIVKEYKDKYNDDEMSINNSAQGKCLYEAIVIVAVGAVALAVYIWAAVARWEVVTYPDEEIQKQGSLYNEELSISIAENI
ncbi:hypothetical protein QP519_08650 [Weeksella virosa]|uniref:hypothetical protein n=1 Tax=Weeksella virosa TaxID=1014 RepID=UPI0025554082|nr:hypothetical protein [Weeksella virosa]MDK7375603.1 hypothetical protein [Weeksella virosa]